MNIWFDYEALEKAISSWIFPETPYYFNTKKWNAKMRKEHGILENSLQDKKK